MKAEKAQAGRLQRWWSALRREAAPSCWNIRRARRKMPERSCWNATGNLPSGPRPFRTIKIKRPPGPRMEPGGPGGRFFRIWRTLQREPAPDDLRKHLAAIHNGVVVKIKISIVSGIDCPGVRRHGSYFKICSRDMLLKPRKILAA